MEIKLISYKRTRSVDRFGSCTLDVSCEVKKGESAQDAHDDLVRFVESNIDTPRRYYKVTGDQSLK